MSAGGYLTVSRQGADVPSDKCRLRKATVDFRPRPCHVDADDRRA